MARKLAFRAACLMVVALPVTSLSGCGETEETSPSADPPPTSVRDADPCAFLPESVVAAYDLEQVQVDDSETSRSCGLLADDGIGLMILVRWDPNTLVDFSRAFPVLGDDGIELSGVRATFGKNAAEPVCAALFLAERGTVVEIIVGDEPPSTAEAACERVKDIGASMVQEVRDQNLLDVAPTAAPTTSDVRS